MELIKSNLQVTFPHYLNLPAYYKYTDISIISVDLIIASYGCVTSIANAVIMYPCVPLTKPRGPGYPRGITVPNKIITQSQCRQEAKICDLINFILSCYLILLRFVAALWYFTKETLSPSYDLYLFYVLQLTHWFHIRSFHTRVK